LPRTPSVSSSNTAGTDTNSVQPQQVGSSLKQRERSNSLSRRNHRKNLGALSSGDEGGALSLRRELQPPPLESSHSNEYVSDSGSTKSRSEPQRRRPLHRRDNMTETPVRSSSCPSSVRSRSRGRSGRILHPSPLQQSMNPRLISDGSTRSSSETVAAAATLITSVAPRKMTQRRRTSSFGSSGMPPRVDASISELVHFLTPSSGYRRRTYIEEFLKD
jgi:hypothetical protein